MQLRLRIQTLLSVDPSLRGFPCLSFQLIPLQVPRTTPIKGHLKLPLLVSQRSPRLFNAVPNQAQAPEVTPDKVWDLPPQFTAIATSRLHLHELLHAPSSSILPRILGSNLEKESADFEMTTSIDQSPQCSPTHGSVSCMRSFSARLSCPDGDAGFVS